MVRKVTGVSSIEDGKVISFRLAKETWHFVNKKKNSKRLV